MPEPALLVTGATGFVGGHLLRQAAAAGHPLLALARPSSARGHLDDLDLAWHTGDVTDPASVDAAASALAARGRAEGRPTWLVHGAAVISYATGVGPLQQAVNVDGTRHVLDAAERHGIDRVLLVSSVVTVGVAADAEAALDEDAPFADVARVTGRPYVSEYMRTKRAGEDLALARAAAWEAGGGPELVVVNPGAIFGEAPTPSNTAQVFRRVEGSLLGRVAGPGSLSVVGVEDVARGILLALERGRTGRRYLLTDENLRLEELLRRIQRVLRPAGPQPGLLRPGPRAWRALVGATRLLDRVKPLHVVTPTALELLALHFRFDSTRARTELGWTPEPFDDVLENTATWLRRIGWVRPASS